MECATCHNKKIGLHDRWCRRCGSKNPRYVEPKANQKDVPRISYTEVKLARALYSKQIRFEMQPQVWLSSCQPFTPDFLIEDDFIVEVDGPHHDQPHRVLMDRIRQRALENSGYLVLRVNVSEIDKSVEQVVQKIISKKSELSAYARAPKIIEVDVPPESRLSNIWPDGTLKGYAKAINLMLHHSDGYDWTPESFEKILSNFKPFPNRCAMTKIMLNLLGLNFASKKLNGSDVADFEKYAFLYGKAAKIMKQLFGAIASVEFRNEFNITASNFMKNLIFYGKPNVLHKRLIWIRTSGDIAQHISEFNMQFSKFNIIIEEEDVKKECIDEKQRIARTECMLQFDSKHPHLAGTHPYKWLKRWKEESKEFQWLDTWCK